MTVVVFSFCPDLKITEEVNPSVVSQRCTKKPRNSLEKLLKDHHQTPGVDTEKVRAIVFRPFFILNIYITQCL